MATDVVTEVLNEHIEKLRKAVESCNPLEIAEKFRDFYVAHETYLKEYPEKEKELWELYRKAYGVLLDSIKCECKRRE